ncbi:MAG: DUF4179 domain-containing protein [Clostridiales bacterium]|jgi:hypothetical protein|nr:DUF4179 domain-containing protein [Clostridiales bacterium]
MNNKEEYTDALLKRALESSEGAGPELIKKIKFEDIKEGHKLKKLTIRRPFSAVAAIIIACTFIPATVFAAWYFLSPSQVAKNFEYPILAEAFESEGALIINETQSDNGYNISLLGIVSGKGLDGFAEEVDTDKTYAVVAIVKQGSNMPDTSDPDYGATPFFVSPLIHGQKPWQFNIASMGGGYSAFVRDGVMYRLIDCDSIEMFADRGLTLIVSSTNFYSTDAFDYNEETGLVTPIPNFEGVNLMFSLPIDTSKANYEKAQKYLDSLWNDNTAQAQE